MDPTTTNLLISLGVSVGLLIISEVLPFTSTESQGILKLLMNVISGQLTTYMTTPKPTVQKIPNSH